MAIHFEAYLAWCDENEIPLAIVSDGLDFYIERILANHRLLERISCFSNELTFADTNRIEARFPYFSKGCGRCANCKAYHVREARKDGSKVIFIGDGLSDRCGAQAADYTFARRGRDLERFCDAHGIKHVKFDSFDVVLQETKDIVTG
jgi:HAD superfamily phosphoserine phosphatase-like hydrolase